MTLVSIVGPPGVGKGVLITQLGAISGDPAFSEGEQGAHPRWLWRAMEHSKKPIKVTEYWVDFYAKRYARATECETRGKLVFIEGGRMTVDAHIPEYPAYLRSRLHALAETLESEPDLYVMLDSGVDTVEKHIRKRKRAHEDIDAMISRYHVIREGFLALAKERDNALVINRDGMELFSYDAQRIHRKIMKELEQRRIPVPSSPYHVSASAHMKKPIRTF